RAGSRTRPPVAGRSRAADGEPGRGGPSCAHGARSCGQWAAQQFQPDAGALRYQHRARKDGLSRARNDRPLDALPRRAAKRSRAPGGLRRGYPCADAAARASARGDRLVRLALLAFTIVLLDVTPSGGRIGSRLTRADGTSAAAIAITTSRATLPPDLVASLFRLSRTAESPFAAAIAGRLIIEAQGGDVALESDGVRRSGFRIHIPGTG